MAVWWFSYVVAIVCCAALVAAQPTWVNLASKSRLGLDLTSQESVTSGDMVDGDLGDYDGDGRIDLLVSGGLDSCGGYPFDRIALLHQSANGTFSDGTNAFGLPSFHSAMYSMRYLKADAAVKSDLAICDHHFLIVFSYLSGGVSLSSSPSALPPNCSYGLLVSGDWDHDKSADVFVASNGNVYFAKQEPNGTLVSNTALRLPSLLPAPFYTRLSTTTDRGTVVFADSNHDGFDDLLLLGWKSLYNENLIVAYMLLSAGNGSYVVRSNPFVAPSLKYYTSAGFADLDGDGFADLIVSWLLSPSTSYYSTSFRNLRNNSFQVDGISGLGPRLAAVVVQAAPLSHATLPDVVVAGTTELFSAIFRNLLNGTFVLATPAFFIEMLNPLFLAGLIYPGQRELVTFGRNPGGSTVRIISGTNGPDTYYVDSTNRGFPSASLQSDLFFGNLAVIDYNRDGCLDLHVQGLNYRTAPVSSILVGSCNGTLSESSANLNPVAYGAALWNDFDGDGWSELLTSGIGLYNSSFVGPVSYFYSSSASGMQFVVNQSFSPPLSGGAGVGAALFRLFPGSGPVNDVALAGARDLNDPAVGLSVYRHLGGFNFSSAGVDLIGYIFPYFNVIYSPFPTAAMRMKRANLADNVVFAFQTAPFSLHNYGNGSLAVRLFSDSFPGVQIPDLYPVADATDLNGDQYDDLVIAGLVGEDLTKVFDVYFMLPNGSATIQHDAAPQDYVVLAGALLLADFDEDGDMDVAVSGLPAAYLATKMTMVILRNDGIANFSTPMPGFPSGDNLGYAIGDMVADSFTSLYDDSLDLIVSGISEGCGPGFFMQPAPIASTTSSRSEGGSSSALGAEVIGALAGSFGLAALLLVCCCLIVCCVLIACLACVVAVVFVLIVIVVLLVAAVIAVAGGGSGAAAFLLLRRGGRAADSFLFETADGDNIEELLRMAERVTDVRQIPWKEIALKRKLGSGAFGDVMLADWNGVEVAVKMFRSPTKEAIDDFHHEALMMSKVSHHPNVVSFIGASFPPDGIAMVMGLCAGGSLSAALEREAITPSHKLKVMIEISSAVAFLHSLGIVHRDIAARNVLLDADGRARLSDLGLSRLLEKHQSTQTTSSYIGPVRWMSPEALSQHSYSAASDAYSFAILMWELLSNGAIPMAEIPVVHEVALAVVRDDARPKIADDWRAELVILMRKLWRRDPAERLSLADAHTQLLAIQRGEISPGLVEDDENEEDSEGGLSSDNGNVYVDASTMAR